MGAVLEGVEVVLEVIVEEGEDLVRGFASSKAFIFSYCLYLKGEAEDVGEDVEEDVEGVKLKL